MTQGRFKMVLLLVATFSVGLYVGWRLHGQAAIDKCLDLGGRWHPYGICDGIKKAPFS